MKIKLYTSSHCEPCKELEKALKKRGIKFKEINVDDEEGLREAISEGIRILPTIEIGRIRLEGKDAFKIKG